jgi:hypothetical protein
MREEIERNEREETAQSAPLHLTFGAEQAFG